jgi:hypothetical protein
VINGVLVLQLIAAADEAHSAVDVAVALEKLVVEDDEGRCAFDYIGVDFEAGSVLCTQAMDPFGRESQSIIFSLNSRPHVNFDVLIVGRHMYDDFDKTPSFVDVRAAQKVRVARGK